MESGLPAESCGDVMALWAYCQLMNHDLVIMARAAEA